MSAMGSLIINCLLRLLPTGFDHSGDFAIQGEQPEAKPANAELTEKAPRAPTTPAAIAVFAAELRLPALYGCFEPEVFGDLSGGSHVLRFSLLPERHSHLPQ